MATPDMPEKEGHDDVKFLEPPPDTLMCPICLSVLYEPHLLSCCGTHICQKCIGEVKGDGQPCPCCREANYSTMLNKQTRGKVLGLRVDCNMEGCDWKGELGDLKRHFADKCLYVERMCPYGCGQTFPRHVVETHKTNGCQQLPQLNVVTLQQQMSNQCKMLEKAFREKTISLEKNHEYDICQLTKKIELQEKKFEKQTKDLCVIVKDQNTKHSMLLETLNSQRARHESETSAKTSSIVKLEAELREAKHALETQALKIKLLEQDMERMRDFPPHPPPPHPRGHHHGPPPRHHHFRGHH